MDEVTQGFCTGLRSLLQICRLKLDKLTSTEGNYIIGHVMYMYMMYGMIMCTCTYTCTCVVEFNIRLVPILV